MRKAERKSKKAERKAARDVKKKGRKEAKKKKREERKKKKKEERTKLHKNKNVNIKKVPDNCKQNALATSFSNPSFQAMRWIQSAKTTPPISRPAKCPMPEMTLKEGCRRLEEARILEADAALACARVKESDRDACILDVLATNDKEAAGSY